MSEEKSGSRWLEKSFIATLICFPNKFEQVQSIVKDSTYLQSQDCAEIYSSVVELYRQGKSIDRAVVADHLSQKGKDRLAENLSWMIYENMAEGWHLLEYANQIADHHYRRKIAEKVKQMNPFDTGKYPYSRDIISELQHIADSFQGCFTEEDTLNDIVDRRCHFLN